MTTSSATGGRICSDPKQTVFNTSVLLIQYNENKNVSNGIMLGWLNEDAC